ncbi:MAG: gamma-glutamyltransferase family protein [Acidimicrobiales bacterium]
MNLAPFVSRYAPSGMVCAVDHLAAAAGVDLLRRGGSAADAAVGTSAVLAVTTQHMCGMGGDLLALVHDGAGTGPPVALLASGRAGSGADPGRLRAEGHDRMPAHGDVRAVTVPGCVDGWLALHDRFGRLPLATVLEPARGYATEGFPCSPSLALAARAVAHLPGAASLGRALSPGDLVRRPGVARALTAVIAHGRDGFYLGEFGDGLRALGAGEYVGDDFADPLATFVEPLSLDAFGVRLWTAPPPSQGYLALAGAALADRLAVPGDPGDPRWAHLLIEAARASAQDRVAVLHERADGAALLSPSRLGDQLASISPRRAASTRGRFDAGGTVALCAVDAERMGVTLLQSNASGFGAGLVEPATGIFLHNRGVGFSLEPGHPAEYGPRRRPPHTLSPTLVTDAGATGHQALRAVLGTMGGDAQPQVLLQLLWRLFVGGQRAGDAVAAGRWVLRNARDPGGFWTWSADREVEVVLETSTPAGWPGALAALGQRLAQRSEDEMHEFGHAHVIVCRDGVLEGASDPRAHDGAAAGY